MAPGRVRSDSRSCSIRPEAYGLASEPSGEVRPGWWLGPGCSYASMTGYCRPQSRFLGAARKASVPRCS